MIRTALASQWQTIAGLLLALGLATGVSAASGLFGVALPLFTLALLLPAGLGAASLHTRRYALASRLGLLSACMGAFGFWWAITLIASGLVAGLLPVAATSAVAMLFLATTRTASTTAGALWGARPPARRLGSAAPHPVPRLAGRSVR